MSKILNGARLMRDNSGALKVRLRGGAVLDVGAGTQPGVYNLNPSTLAKWRALFGRIKSGKSMREVIAISGNSTKVSLGANAENGYAANAYVDGFCAQFATALSTAIGVTVTNHSVFGDQSLGAAYIYANPVKCKMEGGLLTSTSGVQSSSVGGQGFLFNTAGHKLTQSFDTPIDTFVLRNLGNYGYGNCIVTLDAGATSFTLAGGSAATSYGLSGNHAPAYDQKTFTVARGAHTIQVLHNSGQLCYYGADAWDSTLKHVAIWNFGESGAGMAAKSNAPAATSYWSQLPALIALAPSIGGLIIDPSINDMIAGTSPAAFSASLNAVLDGVLAANPNIALAIGVDHATSHATEETNRAALVTAAKNIAFERGIFFFDMKERLGPWSTLSALGYFIDDRHAAKTGISAEVSFLVGLVTG